MAGETFLIFAGPQPDVIFCKCDGACHENRSCWSRGQHVVQQFGKRELEMQWNEGAE